MVIFNVILHFLQECIDNQKIDINLYSKYSTLQDKQIAKFNVM